VVPTEHGRIAVMICYDLEFPEWVRLPALGGAQLLAAPVNWPAYPRPDGERAAEVVRVQADAGVNRMFVAACDRAGAERGADWVGGSVIVDPDGFPLAEAAPGAGADTITAGCRLGEALDKGVSKLSDIHADRRPELYARVTERVSR
jgi:predicted amidohydrolase